MASSPSKAGAERQREKYMNDRGEKERKTLCLELKRFHFALKERGLQLLLTRFGVIPIERRRIPCFIGRALGWL